ncbi:MAG: hypothetical protein H6745_08140 [Deltaproteobacteria bacterium]|nr:hypothetical protein [Deltaproteobacteria bacterium]
MGTYVQHRDAALAARVVRLKRAAAAVFPALVGLVACATTPVAPTTEPTAAPDLRVALGAHVVESAALDDDAPFAKSVGARPFWCPAAASRPPTSLRDRAAACVDRVSVLLVPYPSVAAAIQGRQDWPTPLPQYEHAVIAPDGAIHLVGNGDLTGAEAVTGRWHTLLVVMLSGDDAGHPVPPTDAAYAALATLFSAARRAYPAIPARFASAEPAELSRGLAVAATRDDEPALFDVLRFCDAAKRAGVPLDGCPTREERVTVRATGADAATVFPWRFGELGLGAPETLPGSFVVSPGWSCARTQGRHRCRYFAAGDDAIWDLADAGVGPTIFSVPGAIELIGAPSGASEVPMVDVRYDTLKVEGAVRPYWCPAGADLPPTSFVERSLLCVDALRVRRVGAADVDTLPGPPHVIIDGRGAISNILPVESAGPPAGTTRDTAVTIWVVADPAAAAVDALTPLQEATLASVLVTVKRLYPRIPPLGPAPVGVDSPGLGLDGDAPIDWARLRAAVRAIDPAAVTP